VWEIDRLPLSDALLAAVQSALTEGSATLPSGMTPFPVAALHDLGDTLDTRAATEESADDPESRAKLQQEVEEIEARKWLGSIQSQVETQIDRLVKTETLAKVFKSTHTGQITSKVSDLTQQLITTRFCKQFTHELAELGLETLSVDLLDVGGSKGKTEFGVRINGAAIPTIKLREIASEGEQRCIALALFLAELSTASHRSALVFDDPVSSLDHEHRGKIAARLVKESKTRQVIVFTHDTVFLSDLQLLVQTKPAQPNSGPSHGGLTVQAYSNPARCLRACLGNSRVSTTELTC
jgi:energy-coupling factor transporter ATP-binding protein EcfA2